MRRALLLLLLLLAALVPAQFDEQGVLPLMPPKRWAIVIGAGKYETLGELRYAPADARDFAKLLVEDYKFRPESVTKLIDEPNETPPTVDNIRKQLDQTLGDPRLNKGDLFIFYFSGHGVGTAKGDYLCPTDATKDNITEVGLPVKEVIERIVKAGLRNVLVITDACRGGEKNSFGQELAQLSEKANIGVMLGCEPGRRSYQNARAGHGYFTDALLEALRKPELRQKDTGALWASDVGKFLAEEVQKDTGKRESIPQVPSIECDDRRDVMVAAFLPPSFDEKTLVALKAVKEGLDPSKLSATLALYAERLWDAGRLNDAAEVYRVVDSLTGLDSGDRLLLATALENSGRNNEAGANFRKVATSDMGFYRDLAVLLDPQNRDIRLRLAAASRAFEQNSSASFACGLVPMTGAPGDDPARTALIERFLRDAKQLKEQTRLYLEGELALDRFDLPKAEGAFREAVKTFGVQLLPNRIRWQLVRVLISQLKIQESLDVCTEAIAEKGDDESGWLLMRGLILRLHRGDRDGAAKDAKAALKLKLRPDEMLTAARVLGKHMMDSVAELKTCSDSNPRSAEAQIVGYIASFFSNEKALPFQLPANHPAIRYAEDPKAVLITYEKATASFWQDLMDDGVLEPNAMAAMIDSRASSLLAAASVAGFDDDYWTMLAERCLQARRAPQAFAYFNRTWSKALGAGNMRANVLASYAMIALSAGEWKTVDAICAIPMSRTFETQDLPWLHAISLLLRGEEKAAYQEVAKLGSASEGYKDLANGLRLLAKIQGLDAKAASKILDTAPKPELVVGNVILALGWLEVGQIDKAAPLLEQAGAPDNWAHQAVDAYVLSRFSATLNMAGNVDGADQILFLLQFMFPWMPCIDEIHYGPKASLADYAGEYKFSATQVADDRTITATTASYTVTAQGKVTGKVAGYELTATVDAKGNLRGTATGEGKTWKVYAKLAPKTYYTTFDQLKAGNQTLILQSEDGPRLAYLLKIVD